LHYYFKFFFVLVMKIRIFSFLLVLILLLPACRSTKYVPEGAYLLDNFSIKTDNPEISRDKLKDYLRQTPNARVFGLFRMQLGIYNWAPKDTTNGIKKLFNRTFKRIGDPPVIYNQSLTALSVQQLQRTIENKGFMHAKVQSKLTTKGKKATVDYIINSNTPYRLRNYQIDINNGELSKIAEDTTRSLIRPNMLFDIDVMNAERDRITTRFRQEGYYNFNKDFLDYTADSTLNLHKVDVKLQLREYASHPNDSASKVIFKRFTIRKVIFYTNSDVNLTSDITTTEKLDTVQFRDFILVSPKKRILKLDALVQNTYINPKALYSDEAVERTYSGLNSLGPVKYVNISFKDAGNSMLDCYVIIIPSKTISLSTELEATYTAGYWGVAGNINYVDKNLYKGAETLSLLARGAFEWQDGVWAREYGGQVGLKFPRFMLPFASYDFKRNMHANTEFISSLGYQDRPGEFTTTNVSAGINYSWKRKRFQHMFQLFDLSYVQFYINPVFRDSFLNPLKPKFTPYNYEDHFIMRAGYAGSYTSFNPNRPMQDYTFSRYSMETAGNVLNGLSKLFGTPDSTGNYKVFGIRFSQYVKGEFHITHHQIFDKDNRFVYHLGVGLAMPYGNAEVIPFEKRFYSGGANSVRGWGESMLGPGEYKRITSLPRDFNQVGDIKLDMNLEYRTKMFWLLEGALFLDGGNIWTIKDYSTQSLGVFKFDTFMNQIAIAYGVGLRFDFSFFIARVDLGMKLYNPVLTRTQKWRISPGWDDMALHFAIGYPF